MWVTENAFGNISQENWSSEIQANLNDYKAMALSFNSKLLFIWSLVSAPAFYKKIEDVEHKLNEFLFCNCLTFILTHNR